MKKDVNMFKKTVSLILCIITVLSICVTAFAAVPKDEIISETWCVMDAKTGQILIGGDENKKMEPASITKILTCALALERLDPKAEYTFSKEAASYDKASTHLAFSEGETCTVEDLLYGAMVESANDCAMALADAASGSQLAFVRLMNEKLAELGCTGSHFSNSTGMPEMNHYTTARDMAIITKYALSVPGFMTYFSAWEWTIPATNKNSERTFGTHHSMIVGSQYNATYGYDYATGGKLGWTEEAMHTAVTTADNGEMELICVVMKSKNKNAKYKDSTLLLDYCFNNFKSVEIPVSVRKSELDVYEGEELYGKMTVYPMAAINVLLTDDMSVSDVTVKANIPESCQLSEVSSVALNVSFSKSSENMSTGGFTLSPEYHIVKESMVISSEAEMEKEGSTFRWWIFIAIPLGVIGAFVVIILIIRAYNIRKYQKLRRHRHYRRLGHDK
ncbi:MAG: D-alanyl-D-alanine carboxypeptidase [Oscillospiraceae bacterium]|nr:D-alanyl-D-alanine carboxypeptidase [Oscillospiraceae bacterium]